MTVWGNYLAMHARKQLAFDMWWLGLALFLLCIIEVCFYPFFSILRLTIVISARPAREDRQRNMVQYF